VEGGESVVVRGDGISHGDASSWAAMVSSMLASPPGRVSFCEARLVKGRAGLHGASEQYMWRVTSSLHAKG